LKKKIDELNNEKSELNNNYLNIEKKLDEESQKYNDLDIEYKTKIKEITKLKKKLEECDKELNDTKMENENSIRDFKTSKQKYNEDYDELNNKISEMQKELNKLKRENEKLLNENKNLSNDNEELLEEQKKNKELISSYKDNIKKLKDEISSLKKTLEEYQKEIEEINIKKKIEKKRIIEKNNDSSSNNSKSKSNIIEDEIVIVKKETTYARGYGFEGEFDKNGEMQTNYSVQKKVDLNETDIHKYHDIIQDLSNMILIYENFFFKKDVKPKNNSELLCVLIVEYIKKRMNRIKLNALINLIIHANTLPKKNGDRNGISRDDNLTERKTNTSPRIRHTKKYYNERSSENNINEDE